MLCMHAREQASSSVHSHRVVWASWFAFSRPALETMRGTSAGAGTVQVLEYHDEMELHRDDSEAGYYGAGGWQAWRWPATATALHPVAGQPGYFMCQAKAEMVVLASRMYM